MSRNEHFTKISYLDFHSPLIGYTFKMICDFLELDKKITELQLFEGDRVSRVDFEKKKNQV